MRLLISYISDRENATVFVTGLQEGLKDDELKRLFKDVSDFPHCGLLVVTVCVVVWSD